MTPRSNRNSRRIISLAPSATSILIALDAKEQLVGVSKWCKDVADVRGLPEFGDCWALENSSQVRAAIPGDAECIRELQPTVIIGSVPFKTEVVEQILALPFPFLALNPRSLVDVEADIRLLGGIAGVPARAEELIREMREKFARIRAAAKRVPSRPRVYCEAWPHPRISSPPWVAELVEIAGGEMVLPAGQKSSDDAVRNARPDVVILAWTAAGENSKPEKMLADPAWKDLPAVRNKRVVAVRDEWLNTPGPPLLRGAGELLRILHPEIVPPRKKPASRARQSRRRLSA